MKKLLSIIMALSMIIALTACGAENASSKEYEEEELAGGWTVSGENGGAGLDGEVQGYYDKAVKSLDDKVDKKNLTPIGLLAMGKEDNSYVILCNLKKSSEKYSTKILSFVVNGEKTENVKLSSFVIPDYTKEYENPDGNAAYEINSSLNAATLPENVQTAWDKAFEVFCGSSMTPVAYLGSQVVAGSNYAVLCTSKTVTMEPVIGLKVIIIYADLEGNAEITSICDVDLDTL